MRNLLLSAFATVATLVATDVRGTVVVTNAADASNVIVYIDNIPGKSYPPPVNPVILDQHNLRFVPHVLPVLLGTTVVFPNNDEVRHNVFSPSPAKRFNLGTYPRGMTRQIRFDHLGEVDLLCNVHPEMSAYVLVLQNPYFAVTDRDGRFVLTNVPPGKYIVKAWREQRKTAAKEIDVADGGYVHISLAVK